LKIIEKYFTGLSTEQKEQFTKLGPLYHFWNEKINVISRKDIDNLYLHHILHSLSIGLILRFNPGTVIIDAGTGGGFPGIPLAILFPESRFILTDSITKKTVVAENICREINLQNCEVKNIRVEKLPDRADFVVCRAVAEIVEIMGWVKKNIVPGGSHSLKNGLLALKGGDLTVELGTLMQKAIVYPLSDYFSESFFDTKKIVYLPG
jgi:16S rRNA (guanine527-N7)-methyltransferase